MNFRSHRMNFGERKKPSEIVPWLWVLALTVALILLFGCSSVANHPIEITCSGKGSITGSGYAGGTAALGVHESNTFTLTADCGDSGFHYVSGPPKPAAK